MPPVILGLSSTDQPTRLPIRWNADDENDLAARGIPDRDVVESPPAPRDALFDDDLGPIDDGPDARGRVPRSAHSDVAAESSTKDVKSVDDVSGDDDGFNDERAATAHDTASHARAVLRRRDRFERELRRVQSRRERREWVGQRRRGRARLAGGSPDGSGGVETERLSPRGEPPHLPPDQHVVRKPDRHRQRTDLPAEHHLHGGRGDLAAHPGTVKRFVSGPLHGAALALYFLLLPFVVVDKWRTANLHSNGTFIRGLLVALAAFWIAFALQVARHIVRIRRGESAGPGGSAWLAGVVVALAALLLTPGLSASAPRSGHSHEMAPASAARHPTPRSAVPALSTFALAVAARRRRDALRESDDETNDDHVENSLSILRHANPGLLAHFNRLVAPRREGVVRVRADFAYAEAPGDGDEAHLDPLCVVILDSDDAGTVVSFAREGGRLRVHESTGTQTLRDGCVCAHAHGSLRVATSEAELLRELAVRALGSTLVVYDGPPVDAALAARCVVVTRSRSPRARETLDATASPPSRRSVRVELLRAEPRVVGLVEPFVAPLQRRCVEMTAYLALHRHDPVTGDRLRTRVLAHADVDASARTLANVASTIRRSLGVDAQGPRLHPVSSAGLYSTHELDSDVEEFHRRVGAARDSGDASSLRGALELVQGEPLSSVLRGFEWFLAEGHWARLLREGEWAALALSRWALETGDVDLAFWAIERGRLLDPYSDVLASALASVPRLREFGGDGAGAAQNETVGAGRTVVARRARGGFGE